MGLMQRLFGGGRSSAPAAVPANPTPVRADAGGTWMRMDDPLFLEFVRQGAGLFGEGTVSVEKALRNPAVFRCVTLISSAIGMLPLHLKDNETKENASDHPLFKILHRQPNSFQSAFDFRSLMQLRALTRGDAYALVIRGRDLLARSDNVIALVPLDPDRVTPKLDEATWTVVYEYQAKQGGRRVYPARDILHLRGQSLDGLHGVSLVRQAADAIRLALDADLAVRRLFQKGSFVGGVLSTPNELSQEAYDRLKASWNEEHSGAENAGSTPLLEGGTEYKSVGGSAKDAQSNETRGRQVEEIARVFGVPRPLLMVDETSWGSGIDALGQFFVRYALGPWFEAWQQAVERCLLDEEEKERFSAKFNPGALIRGSMKDQGEFFAKALGAGGHRPWMTSNEIRGLQDMPAHPDGNRLDNPMTAPAGGRTSEQ